MALVKPAQGEALDAVSPVLELVQAHMGFTPNSLKTMAHCPDITNAFAGLSFAVLSAPGTLSPDLKMLVGYAASAAHGCRYCQAHTALGAQTAGLDEDKIKALPDYETSPLFTAAERAAMRFAQCAAQTPSLVGEAETKSLKAHFSDKQIVELVAVIALFGFLNRWNDTMGTALEDAPAAFAQTALAPSGWAPGKHG